jgi:anthranilate phosphoribosyltransferase
MMKAYLEKVMARQDLTQEEAREAFDTIMSGRASPAQMAGFLVAMRMKGETPAELAGGALSMRSHAVQIDVGTLRVVDTCGTGGTGCHAFNVSTTGAFVTAGAGVPVAKHGNRSITSTCGSADVLEALGVNLDVTAETVEQCIRDAGIGFMFAPRMHPAMKHAMGTRKELGIRTMFNMLGPLTNPARARCQVLGVFAPELTESFANVLRLMGSERAFVVHGLDGMDEITTTSGTRVSELKDGDVTTYELDPTEFVDSLATPQDLAGGDPATNAAIARAVLLGEAGAARDIVCLNAGAAIVAGGKAESLAQGVELARSAIDSGRAEAALASLVQITNGS